MAKQKTKKFEKAVLATPEVSDCYQQGLKALGNYSRKVELSDVRKAEGSVDIDTCISALYPHANRWDYSLGYDNEAYFVEVHAAKTIEVSTVLNKLQWLKDWLNDKAPELNNMKAKKRTPFYWIQSGKFDILKTSPQYRRLVNEGLVPIPKLKL